MKLFCFAAAVVLAGLLSPQLSHAQMAMAPMKRVVSPDTPQNARLVAAVEAADLAAVQNALRSGASADTEAGWEEPAGIVPPQLTPPKLTSVAVLAANSTSWERGKHLPIFRLLIQNVSASSIADPKIAGPLLYAAVEMNDLDSVQRLAARGININPQFAVPSSILDASIDQSGITVKTLSPVTAFLLDHGALVNARDTQGMTPLMFAAEFGKTEVVRALLAHGADPALRDKRGWTALDWTALYGGDDVIALLRDRSPMDLYEAAQFGDVARLRACLDAGDNPNALRIPTYLGLGSHANGPKPQGTTPLMEAMKSGSVETARLLLDRGADVNGKRPDGTTALHLAARYGDAPLAALLLDRGADINAVVGKAGHPATPLSYAVAQAHADVVALLLKRGADLSHGQGTAALDVALRQAGVTFLPQPQGQRRSRKRSEDATLDARGQIIDLLLGAGVDVRSKESHALFLVANGGQPGLVELLLDKGADVNGRGEVSSIGIPSQDNGETVLMGAVEAWSSAYSEEVMLKDGTESGGNLKDIRQAEQYARQSIALLLTHGADVNLPDARGTTPLMLCALYDLPTLAELLLAHGANIDAVNPAGQTALMQAAGAGDDTLAALLLAHHASVNKRDKQGRTALMLAVDDGSNDERRVQFARNDEAFSYDAAYKPRPVPPNDLPNPDGHPKTVCLLLDHGASVNAVAMNGATALSLARKENFGPVVTMLTQAGARR